jgi:hypothetical protein
MARSSGRSKAPRKLSVSKQLDFHPLLVAARKTKLASAVAEAAECCDQPQFVPRSFGSATTTS